MTTIPTFRQLRYWTKLGQCLYSLLLTWSIIGNSYPGRPGPSRHEDARAAGGEGGRLRPDHDGGDGHRPGLDRAKAPLQQHL